MGKHATLDDVKEAIIAADKHFGKRDVGDLKQHFECGEVPILCHRGNDRWDYGHPAMYAMDKTHVEAVKTLWKEMHPTTGKVLAREWKNTLNCYQINVQWQDAGKLFNYHVAVT